MKADRKWSFVVLIALVLCCANTAIAATIYVSQEERVGAYETIQQAINAAGNGDIVFVADGTYTGEGNTNLTWNGNEKHITVKSENGPGKCIIDCTPEVRLVIDSRGFSFDGTNQNEADVIDGFTIKNGIAEYGGGILCYASSPTITNCIIEKNTAYLGGGGIFCEDSSPTITNCIIKENETENYGGGIACENASPTISDCTIEENETLYAGGGIFCFNSSATVSNCIILGNIVYFDGGGFPTRNGELEEAFGGGGIFCLLSSPTITDCIIKENGAFLGGGIIIYDSMILFEYPSKSGLPIEESLPITITNCTIEENGAYIGGGITIFSGAMMDVINKRISEKPGLRTEEENLPITLTDCTIKENEAFLGGGVAMLGSMIELFEFDKRTHDKDVIPIDEIVPITITNCIIAENYAEEAGGGIFSYVTPPLITNCTIVENETGGWGGGISCGFSLLNITNCTIAENYADEAGDGIDSYVSLMVVKNSILWGNGDTPAKNGGGGSEEEICLYEGSDLTVSYSEVEGGEEGVYVAEGEGCVFNWGEGNINEDPLFVKKAHNIADVTDGEDIGYHLSKNSPCIDKGTNEDAPDNDIDGQKRPFGDTTDIGSDEYVWTGSVNSGDGQVNLYLTEGAFTEFETIDEENLPDEGKPELTFPFGFSSFRIIDIEKGGTVDIVLTCSEDVPISAAYWKYDENRQTWYQLPFGSNDGDNIIILTITDGGEGDEDGEANGMIVDPGAIGWDRSQSDDDDNPCFLQTIFGIAKTKSTEIIFARNFRDTYLASNPMGQILISAYYKTSPTLVRLTKKRPALTSVAKKTLEPIIWLTEKLLE